MAGTGLAQVAVSPVRAVIKWPRRGEGQTPVSFPFPHLDCSCSSQLPQDFPTQTRRAVLALRAWKPLYTSPVSHLPTRPGASSRACTGPRATAGQVGDARSPRSQATPPPLGWSTCQAPAQRAAKWGGLP